MSTTFSSRPRRTALAAAAVAALGTTALLVGGGAAVAGDDGDGILIRSGVAGSTPVAAGGVVLFGSPPGGRPWVADPESKILVTRDGELIAKVRGLVIPGNPSVNPVPALSANLVCNGVAGPQTATVPFDAAGNADIKATVPVPATCVAPIVLLHPNGLGAYIGATG